MTHHGLVVVTDVDHDGLRAFSVFQHVVELQGVEVVALVGLEVR